MRFLHSRTLVAFLACAAVALPRAALAVASANDVYPAAVVTAAPPLDFDFAKPPWAAAKAIGDFETLTTRTRVGEAAATTVRVVFDASSAYVGFHCEQRGIPIVATQTTNNVGFGLDDYVGIGIDTTGNGQTYYFETTSRAVRYQSATESSRYNPVWTALARRTATGWDAILIVPFRVLRTPHAAAQRWRVNVVRHLAAPNENQTWAYDPLMNDGGGGSFPQLGDARFWPSLDGVKVAGNAIRPKPRAEIFALASAGHDRNVYQQASQLFAPQGTRNVGVDLNVPITSTLAFVGAVAPDFSNVEIDQQTISPQEFRRGLSEYRPFFAQGADFFSPVSLNGINAQPNQIFYSPGIGSFDRGAKIEGTFGHQAIGLLDVSGAGFNDEVLAYKHTLSDRTFSYSFDAVSAHHAFGNETASPAAANDTSYEGQISGRNLHNGFVYAADYALENNSAVPGTSARLAYKTESFVDVHRQNYETFFSYHDIGPKWNPVDGFTNVADLRGPQTFVDLSGTPSARSPLKRAELFVTGDRFTDGSGAVHQADFNANVSLLFKNLISVSGGPSYSALRFYDDGLALVGYDGGYARGVTVPFVQNGFQLGYKDGSATPFDASTSWGPFSTFNADGTLRSTYLRQYSLSTSRPVGTKFNIGIEYDGTLETIPTADVRRVVRDGQNLRRISLGEAIDRESNLSISLRQISGAGGFGLPGVNLAASFHRRFNNGNELFVNYGTPAAPATLQRAIVKYVLRIGSGAGT